MGQVESNKASEIIGEMNEYTILLTFPPYKYRKTLQP